MHEEHTAHQHRWVQTVSLGNWFQYSVILTVREGFFFLLFKWIFLYFNWCLMPLGLSLDWDAKSKRAPNESCYSERATRHNTLSDQGAKRPLICKCYCITAKVTISSLLFTHCPFKVGSWLMWTCEAGKQIHASFIHKFYSMFCTGKCIFNANATRDLITGVLNWFRRTFSQGKGPVSVAASSSKPLLLFFSPSIKKLIPNHRISI